MKQYTFLILLLLMVITASSQTPQIRECGTTPPTIKPVLTPEMMQRAAAHRVQYSAPYPMKVFVRVFADNDGSNLAATEEDVLRQFENMRVFYAPHDICFILVGYEVTRNSDLNNMDKDESDDRDQLEGFVFNSCMNIFVHRNLVDNDGGLNGTAYDIPNHFLSLVGDAVASTSNLSTMAHEMGHCLGLLHTFEDAYGQENVARSGDCKDCDGDGDLLCDTQADLNNSSSMINTNCNYTGSATDDCGAGYLMEETNVMTYGRRSCRDHFTNGQGARARTYVLSDHENRIAENNLLVTNGNYLAGTVIFAARSSITVIPTTSFTVSGAASANFSARAVTLSPGVDLRPVGGYVVVRAGTYCQ
jgi:hypothetical protein